MTNLREQVEADLSFTLEGDWGLPVILQAPDGTTYDKSANDPTADLMGQILYDTIEENPETGQQILVHKPVVTLRLSSLTRVPVAGEIWSVTIPSAPSLTAVTETYLLDHPSEDGRSIGFIRLYLMKAEQS